MLNLKLIIMYGIYKTLEGVWYLELCNTSNSLINLEKDIKWLRENNPLVKYEILECSSMTYPMDKESCNLI